MFASNISSSKSRVRLAETWKIVCLTLLVALMATCDYRPNPTSTDVTNDKKFQGGYSVKSEYVLQQDVFILSVNGQQAELFIPDRKNTFQELTNGDKVEAPTIVQYRLTPAKWPYLIGVLPKGSRISVEKFELYSTITFSQLRIHAIVLDGEFQGRDVEIQSLSTAPGEGLALSPRKEYLEKRSAEP